MKDNVLVWLQKWFLSECDGEWEQEYGLHIETIDNPGWLLEIDLKYTTFENIQVETRQIDNSENDWYFYGIKNSVYKASGDPNKLEFLLLKFKEIVETNSK
jgi:hypothetical protein